MSDLISPASALAHCEPDFLDSLSDVELLALANDPDCWLRPEQQIPRATDDDRGGWSYYGFICGRGYGKTYAIATYINRCVEDGLASKIGLMAPTDDRVDEVQITALIDTAPPWFKPERYNGGLRWPNGAIAYAFSAEAPMGPRGAGGGELHLSWLTEIVAWQRTTRLEAFSNITTATRQGLAQVLWDTTSKGKNDVIQLLVKMSEESPDLFRLQRGEMFDNPQLGETYLRTECKKAPPGTRKHDEEIRGLVFDEAEGATWKQAWISDNRRPRPPTDPIIRLVSCDPAISTAPGTDDTGIHVGSADEFGDVYVEKDLSGRHEPDTWCALLVEECASNNAAGIVIERNRGADVNIALIRVHAQRRGFELVLLKGPEYEDKPFPRRRPGVIFVREMWAATSKQSRAVAPASYGKDGRVHHVGEFAATEEELTTWVPGAGESPNKLDSHSYLVAELAGLNVAESRERPAANAAEAARAHDLLREALKEIGRKRTT